MRRAKCGGAGASCPHYFRTSGRNRFLIVCYPSRLLKNAAPWAFSIASERISLSACIW